MIVPSESLEPLPSTFAVSPFVVETNAAVGAWFGGATTAPVTTL